MKQQEETMKILIALLSVLVLLVGCRDSSASADCADKCERAVNESILWQERYLDVGREEFERIYRDDIASFIQSAVDKAGGCNCVYPFLIDSNSI